MRTRSLTAVLFAAASTLALARPLVAQADVIRGRVTSASAGDAPIENASVTATSLAGGVNRVARTDRNGRYTITFPNGDGDYFITVIAIGYVPRRFEVKRTADQDILIGDTRLTLASSTLDTIVTIGRRDRPLRADTLGDIGGMDRIVNTSNVAIEQLGNLAAMAASTPGLVYIPGVDGDPSGYVALGLEQAQNALTINGMNSVATELPREGTYSVSVALSPYDVSQGQFSGGRTNVRIGSGTNYISRKSSLLVNAPQLEWTDRVGHALGQQYTNLNLGGGVSGPISFDKAFYNVSYQFGRVANDLFTLLDADPLGLQTSGVSPDSIARLTSILGNVQVPATVPGLPTSRLADQGLILGSFDFAPPSSSSGQAFNVTLNGGWTKTSPAAPLTSALPASSFANTSWNGAVQGHHTNYYGFGILSETGVSLSRSRRFTTPYLELPSGNVLVQSDFANGVSGVRSLAFGGTPTSGSATTNSVELTNQLSWFSEDNKHRIKVTTDLRRDAYAFDQANNTLGSFAFNSLAELEAGQAASFTRQLSSVGVNSSQLIGSVAIGDSYRRTSDLQIVYGVRLDVNKFLDRPTPNADLERILGVQNDRMPNGLYVSPRLGFSWTYGTSPAVAAFLGAARIPRAVVRGGIGVFQGVPSATLPSQAIANTGLPSGVQQLTCTGVATPTPNWRAYPSRPDSIPSQCADGSSGTVFASSVPNVTLFAHDYVPPRSIRSNLQWAGPVLDNRVLATVSAIYSRNVHQPGFVDANLDPTTRFTLPLENDRPSFVQPTSIVPATGVVASRDGRRSSEFNRVTELRSDLSSEARQLQLQLVPTGVSTRYTWGFAYTLSSVRDRQNGFTSTAGNPFDVTAGRSVFDWRHQVQFNIGYNLFDVVRLNWFETFLSGMPYTPTVAGDVNGDGNPFNDRAFVFDPEQTADPSLASGMRMLLAGASSGVRECLQRQLRHLAERNSCEAPWTSSAAVRIDFNPVRVRMPQRTMLSLSISNPLAGADLLLHGTNRTHGWGQFVLPDPRLLIVRGFDAQSRSYTYQVNPRFGNTSPATSAFRNPVAVTAMVRVDVG
ncbi:MAG TPA: carboxypeptidase-like regulatory domain-containing protein, partial [Gemmatimonadaceae bacterium]